MRSFATELLPAPVRFNGRNAASAHGQVMTQSTRKLLGVFLILGSLVLWSVLGTWIYMSLFSATSPWWLLIGFFAVLGTSWFFPAAWMIRWMSRPDE